MDVQMRSNNRDGNHDPRPIEQVRSPGPSLKRDRDSPKSSASASSRPTSKDASRAPSAAPSNEEKHYPQNTGKHESRPPRSRTPPTPTQRESPSAKPPSSSPTAPSNAKKQRLSPESHRDGNTNGDVKNRERDGDDDYESGIVVCGNCRARIPFRDPATGAFSLKRWDAHREACKSSTSQPNGHRDTGTAPPSPPNPPRGPAHMHPSSASTHHPISYQGAGTNTPSHAHLSRVSDSPPPNQLPQKKRRAKRTERERIAYLASDPYVAEFEAYRVRCGACQRWIRLRPNSTYCSIPWDAHRRSCLAKRGGGAGLNANGGGGSNAARKPLTTKSSLPLPYPMRRQDSHQSVNSTNDYDLDADADADGDLDAEGEDDDMITDNAGDANGYGSHRQYTNGQTNGNGNQSSAYGRGHAPPPTSASASVDGEGSEGDDPDAEGEIDDEGEYAGSNYQAGTPMTIKNEPPRHQQQEAVRKTHQAHPQANGYAHSPASRGHHPQANGTLHGTGHGHRSGPANGRKEHHTHHNHNSHHQREHQEHHQQHDLGSRDGRIAFIALSIRHLFRTSYDARAGDELTAMALVNYLNAALPSDKHEEFDLSEVTKTVAGALRERGIVKLEGDVVRLLG